MQKPRTRSLLALADLPADPPGPFAAGGGHRHGQQVRRRGFHAVNEVLFHGVDPAALLARARAGGAAANDAAEVAA